MAGRCGVTERDLRELLAAVDPRAHDGAGEWLPASTLSALAALIGCDLVSYQTMDHVRRSLVGQGSDDEDGSAVDAGRDDPVELLELFWRGFRASIACHYPQVHGDHSTVTRLSDFYSAVALGRSPIGGYFAEIGVRHELLVPLPPEGSTDHRVLFFRTEGPDFSERDLLMMSLLRPHLIALHCHQRRRRKGVPSLTPRQTEILVLVAAGYTNGQVARALAVSEGTVRKHLEHVFERLDVTSRSAAVARVIPLLGDHLAG